ncbi:hypothetical protein [Deinococcus hopiensis]|uniref:hypothetical protein n=1 Tax=Deinococcus hopiensis TaxID=309885 RepID=UPI00111C70B9|nr:hypothetical protein [Deinococcus hopiensis]
MRKRLISVREGGVLILPGELLELYRFGSEVEIEATEGGLLLRAVVPQMDFAAANAKLFAEKRGLLERPSRA